MSTNQNCGAISQKHKTSQPTATATSRNNQRALCQPTAAKIRLATATHREILPIATPLCLCERTHPTAAANPPTADQPKRADYHIRFATSPRADSPRFRHLISTDPPAASISFLSFSASSFEMPSLTVLGAPSTRSLASFSPNAVAARTTLMT